MTLERPRDITGRLIVGPRIDEQVQGYVVTSIAVPENPEQVGVWFDDTTPNLSMWAQKGIEKYAPLGLKVFVLEPPGEPFANWRHPAVVNLHEYYPFHSGTGKRASWFRVPRPWSIDSNGHVKRGGTIIQWDYPGMVTGADPNVVVLPPTPAQRRWELAKVRATMPAYIFEF